MFGPGENAAGKVPEVAETGLPELLEGAGAALAAAALQNDLFPVGDFMEPLGKLLEGNEVGAGDVGHCVFVGLTHIEEKKILSALSHAMEFPDAEGRDWRRGGWRHAAKLLVIDRSGDGGVVAADGTCGVTAKLKAAEFHFEGVDMKESANQRAPYAGEEFDGFGGLEGADDPGHDAEHSAFSAGGNEAGFWRVWSHAAVTGTAKVRGEDGALALESKNAAVDVRLFEKNTDVVAQVAGGKVVGAVDHEVIIAGDGHGVAGVKGVGVRDDVDMRIEGMEVVDGGIELGPADISRGVQKLALEVGFFDDIGIDDAENSYARGGKMHGDGGAEAAGPKAEDAGGLELFLGAWAEFRDAEMPGVTAEFGRGKRGGGHEVKGASTRRTCKGGQPQGFDQHQAIGVVLIIVAI